LDAPEFLRVGPEAALTLAHSPRSFSACTTSSHKRRIITLLLIVYFSYRQTIAAYPGGGGSYTVARLTSEPVQSSAAAGLLTDYILTACRGNLPPASAR